MTTYPFFHHLSSEPSVAAGGSLQTYQKFLEAFGC